MTYGKPLNIIEHQEDNIQDLSINV